MSSGRRLRDRDYARLLKFRTGIRRFLRWSEQEAKRVGLTGPQHQLLLAIRGHGSDPSVGDLAHYLLLRHHSVVELIDRAATAGLVERLTDTDDHRIVRLRLTGVGDHKLAALSASHAEELSRLRSDFESLWDDLPTER